MTNAIEGPSMFDDPDQPNTSRLMAPTNLNLEDVDLEGKKVDERD